MAKAILKLEGITKDYKVADTTVHALKGITLGFRKKEFVSILGSSGCGKTTLLNIIGGLDHYTKGDLIIKGVSTKNFKDSDWDSYRNHSIGFVFQSYNLIPHQTVLGNVELALTLSGVSAQERRERAAHALERVGLGGELNKKPNQLSGGQMQRVAIARALVNNPEILLADEPTGALDTATSVQIMDLIKEIAGERLVIMVTHNPELAKRYSSRIVELKDGQIISDSNPFREDEAEQEVAESQPVPQKKKQKTSMSLLTALQLSGRNLLTKKTRTLITSIAGSIGIISVCLVLALSAGFSNYIRKTEEDMLSYYPLEITETTLDPMAIMSGLASASDMPDLTELDNKVYVNSFLTQIAQGMTVSNNIAQEGYIDYIYEGLDESLYYAISDDTGVTLTDNLFTTVKTKDAEGNALTEVRSLSSLKEYFTEVLSKQEEKYAQMSHLVNYLGSVINEMPGTSQFDIDRDRYSEYVLSQYDVLKGTFPQNQNEAVLVIGGNNDLTDLTLAQLGYIDEDTFLSLFELGGGDTQGAETEEIKGYLSYTFDELLEKPFTLFYNDEVYRQTDYSADPQAQYSFEYVGNRGNYEQDGTLLDATQEQGVQIRITGILRLKDGLTYGCLSNGLNVTEQLVDNYIQKNMQSEIVSWMQRDFSGTPTSGGHISFMGQEIYLSPAAHLNGTYYTQISEDLAGYIPAGMEFLKNAFITNSTGNNMTLRSLGGTDVPNELAIYPRDFETKEQIVKYLDAWNDVKVAEAQAKWLETHETLDDYDGPTEITYTDTVGVLMGMMQTILDAITYVLVAFTGISLVVSTVMIGVITYVSVVERTKEIGILRSIGARKKDIKHVFNAETFLIGLCAGLIGIAVAYLLQVIINAILTPLTGIAGLAALPWLAAVIMVVISIVLTLLSGLFPASAAARRDPVVALRTE